MKQKFLTALLLSTLIILGIASQSAVQTEAEESSSPSKQSSAKSAEFVPGEVIVRFREESTAAKTSASGLTMLRTSQREIAAEVMEFEGSDIVSGLRVAQVAPEDTLAAIEAFNSRADVLYAEPNYIRYFSTVSNDLDLNKLWGLVNTGQSICPPPSLPSGCLAGGTPNADVNADEAWNITKGSHDVVVGVIDQGVDVNHPDLKANIWRNPGETASDGIDNDSNGFVDDVNGFDFLNRDGSVFDNSFNGHEHGTHVAGTIGAVGNNGFGITGINWQVSIMSFKVADTANLNDRALLEAYAYAKMMRDRGVNLRVLNNSYGGPYYSRSQFDAIARLNESGILFVAAAGNEGNEQAVFPSTYNLPNIINVANTTRFDLLSSDSTFGARAVSIGAPGDEILSTTPNNTYSFFSGTSMASPQVAGAAALVLSANPNISVQNLRGVLAYSGDVLPSLQGKTTTGRRLNAYNALVAAAENDTIAPAPVSDLRIIAQTGRAMTFAWTAVGDDGNSGQAADYDFVFTNSAPGVVTVTPASLSTLLPSLAGSQETATIHLPYRNFAGTVELRTYDNAGNVSRTPVGVTVSVNTDSDPYQTALLSAASPLTTGGTPLGLRADDQYRKDYQLPFAFPFFGQNRTAVTISTNGSLYFSNSLQENDAGGSIEELNGSLMIAGLWDDLRTDRRIGDDVYITAEADRIIFRWQGVTFDSRINATTTRGENPVNFEIELRRDGTIQMRYGSGNTRLIPVVGVSGGEPDAYVIESHTTNLLTLKNLTNAQTVTFTPRPPSGKSRKRVRFL